MGRMLWMFLLAGNLIVAAAKSPFAGTWEGKINDLPGVDLTIEDVGGKISGVVAFYLQLRDDEGKWRVAGKSTVPLLAPRAQGKILAFETLHHKAHGSSELGPNVKFLMELTGANEAVMRKVGEGSDPEQVKLTRRE